MKKIAVFLLSFIFITSTAFTQISFGFSSLKPDYTADEYLDAVIVDSSVSVTMFGNGLGTCSGTIIYEDENNQYILTAKHCVDVTEEMYVEHSEVKYISTSVDDDLALLIIDDKIDNKIFAELGYRDLKVNDDVYHIGFPAGVIYKTSGQMSRITKDWNIYNFKAIPGCSGGGVFNKYGQLVGVLWGGYLGAEYNEPIKSVGESLKDIKRFLKLVLPKALK